MVNRQKDDRADGSDARTVNAVDVEAGYPGAAEKVEKPAADNRTNDAEQDVDDGSLARGAAILLAIKPSTSPSRIHTIIDIAHSWRRRQRDPNGKYRRGQAVEQEIY